MGLFLLYRWNQKAAVLSKRYVGIRERVGVDRRPEAAPY